jgi:DNA primase
MFTFRWTTRSPQRASEWARLVAVELEKALPDLVVSRMAKSLRAGQVLVDWSQNAASKTTIVIWRSETEPVVWPACLCAGQRPRRPASWEGEAAVPRLACVGASVQSLGASGPLSCLRWKSKCWVG